MTVEMDGTKPNLAERRLPSRFDVVSNPATICEVVDLMDKSELKRMVEAANSRYTDPERNRVINEKPGEAPRFEVYHFFMSMCSYKVRAVLDEKDASYASHDIDILPPNIQNYFPEYVRLRVKGGESIPQPLVDGYTGRSSTETEGFDPCVVPTVVDHEAGKVLVNSKATCLYLESAIAGGTELMPKDIESEIIAQMDIVDRTPHVALLYGANPEVDGRPGFVQEMMKTAHDVKIGKLRENMALVPDDPVLVAAYEHKIVKEQKAKAYVRTESDMRASLAEFKALLAELEKQLEATGGEWLFGDRFTMADLFWAVSLFRIQWLGLGYIWATDEGVHLPRVEAYRRRLFARPSIERSTIHWPNAPPSEHVMEYYGGAAETH